MLASGIMVLALSTVAAATAVQLPHHPGVPEAVVRSISAVGSAALHGGVLTARDRMVVFQHGWNPRPGDRVFAQLTGRQMLKNPEQTARRVLMAGRSFPGEVVCVDHRLDYVVIRMLADLPEDLYIPPTSNDLRGTLYVFYGWRFFRAHYVDSNTWFNGWRGWSTLRMPQHTYPGWSGSAVFNERGEIVGIHVGSISHEPTSIITIPSWWTCDRR
jgi:hypothetical protein